MAPRSRYIFRYFYIARALSSSCTRNDIDDIFILFTSARELGARRNRNGEASFIQKIFATFKEPTQFAFSPSPSPSRSHRACNRSEEKYVARTASRLTDADLVNPDKRPRCNRCDSIIARDTAITRDNRRSAPRSRRSYSQAFIDDKSKRAAMQRARALTQ